MKWYTATKWENDIWINLKNTIRILDHFMHAKLVFYWKRIISTKNISLFRFVQFTFILYYHYYSHWPKSCANSKVSKIKYFGNTSKHFGNMYVTYFVWCMWIFVHVYLQDQLLIQRSLYERLKEEIELNTKKIFLANVEYFRRNHAAKIIQRNWKLYCARVPSKKRKNRKLICSWKDLYIFRAGIKHCVMYNIYLYIITVREKFLKK